ncbi:hypothetical protein [Cohnella hashimotonis]|uniref:Lipoprotein n=1 Tax=Cohnella hashimotonis TaxID=2826895 RepID=A0ABT6TPZ7_9BACL|nr:hypothetical protein [Cohnella hashimotonis]MDI4648293.1 hypothetical protein [Cohnella hashimotonis]
MKRKRRRSLAVVPALALACLLVACGGNGEGGASQPASSESGTSVSSPTAAAESHNSDKGGASAADVSVMQKAVVGGELRYFDEKFGAGARQDDGIIVSYMDGKLKVTEDQGRAFNIYNAYVDRKEMASPDDALAFIKQFLPADAVQTKEEENPESKIQTITYTSEALGEAIGMAGQLTISIFKNPEDPTQVRQAQISIDITANM